MDAAFEQRIRDAYAAFARGDIDAVVDGFVPDATWTNPEYAVEGGVRLGRDEVRAGFQALREGFDYAALEIEELTEGPEGVLVLVRLEARGRDSGARFEGTFAHVLRIRDRQVVDFAWFSTPAEGRRAVGLA